VNLIVFDLEWNIGYQPKTFLYHGTELTLRGEIIQIGAARINDRGDVLDTFEVNLKPHIFRKLQHHRQGHGAVPGRPGRGPADEGGPAEIP